MTDSQSRTQDLILQAESSLALLAQLDGEDVNFEDNDNDMDYFQQSDDDSHDGNDDTTPSKLHEWSTLMETSSVEKSILDGLAHVKVQFPDQVVEYIDVNASTTTVGDALVFAWKKRYHTSEFLDKKKLRGYFQGHEVSNSWFLLDCGLALEGTLRLHLTNPIQPWKTTSSTTSYNNLSFSSISSAYGKEKEEEINGNIPITSDLKAAEWMEQQVRPEETDFAITMEKFFEKLDMVDDPTELCQHTLSEFVSILQNHIETKEKSSTIPFHLQSLATRGSNNAMEELKHERNTWRLLFELRELSRQSNADGLYTHESIQLDAETTDIDAIETLERLNNAYAIQKTVVKWLEFIASERVSSTSDRRAMLSRTILQRKQRACSLSVDPDAVLRDGDYYIDADDAEDELDFLKSLWALVRSGRLKEASNLCIQLGQPWRAATLNGGDVCGNCENDDGTQSRWGNPLRILWKQMCWQFAESPINEKNKLHKATTMEAREYEAIIYAALCGHLNVLLNSIHCETWEDHCWSYMKASLQYQEDNTLKKLMELKLKETKLLNENKSDYISIYNSFLERTKQMNRFGFDLNLIFEEISSSQNDIVRQESAHPHRQIQAKLVTSDINSIISRLVESHFKPIHSKEMDWELYLTCELPIDSLSPQLLRFASHFVLFASITSEPFDERSGFLIQKAYIRHLIKHGQEKLVALYTSRLPEDGRLSIYVEFLMAVNDTCARLDCLKSIEKYCTTDLFGKIIKKTVENILKLKLNDRTRIDALELLCYDSKYCGELLYQMNYLVREFIIEDKISKIKNIIQKIPKNTIGILNKLCRQDHQLNTTKPFQWNNYLNGSKILDYTIREYLCWENFLIGFEDYENWRKYIGNNKFGITCFSEEENLVKEMIYHASKGITSILNVLQFQGGWLLDCIEKYHSISSIREKCLPFLTFALIHICTDTITWLNDLKYSPKKYQIDIQIQFAEKGIDFLNIIASEEYKIYQAFTPNEMKKILHLIHSNSMKLISLKQSLN